MGDVYCSIIHYSHVGMLALALEMEGQKRGPEREAGDKQVSTGSVSV
jgi:hypothetical protein